MSGVPVSARIILAVLFFAGALHVFLSTIGLGAQERVAWANSDWSLSSFDGGPKLFSRGEVERSKLRAFNRELQQEDHDFLQNVINHGNNQAQSGTGEEEPGRAADLSQKDRHAARQPEGHVVEDKPKMGGTGWSRSLLETAPALPLSHVFAAMLSSRLSSISPPVSSEERSSNAEGGHANTDSVDRAEGPLRREAPRVLRDNIEVVGGIPWELATVYSAGMAAIPQRLRAPSASAQHTRQNAGTPKAAYVVVPSAPKHGLPKPPGWSKFDLSKEPWLHVVPSLAAANLSCTAIRSRLILFAGTEEDASVYDHFMHHLKTLVVVMHRVWGLDAVTSTDVAFMDERRSQLFETFAFSSLFHEVRSVLVPGSDNDGGATLGSGAFCYRESLIVMPQSHWNYNLDPYSPEALEGAFAMAWLRRRILGALSLSSEDESPGPLQKIRLLYASQGAVRNAPADPHASTQHNDTVLFDSDMENVPKHAVLNEPALLAAVRRLLTHRTEVELVVRNIAALSAREQVLELMQADIFMGPHSSAMMHMLWMRPGTVVLEILPYGFAETGYRNLAHETGKVYLYWQNTDRTLSRAKAQDVRTAKETELCQANSNYVDVADVVGLVRSALVIASQAGRRAWLPCPSGDVYLLKSLPRIAPIDCPTLWVGDTCVEAPLASLADAVEPPLVLRSGAALLSGSDGEPAIFSVDSLRRQGKLGNAQQPAKKTMVTPS